MCRGFQQQNNLLKIKAFYLCLCHPNTTTTNWLPDSLTLHYLPRINASPLEIDQVNLPPDSSGFITLHRVVAGHKGSKGSSVLYGSRQRMGVSEGVKFEVYLGEHKLVRGFFRKDDDEGEWKLELKCGLMVEIIKEVEVCVEAEGGGGGVMMNERVEMVVKRKRRGRCFHGLELEEIPEEREGELVVEEEEGCCCDGGKVEGSSDDREVVEAEMEMERVRWALDVGIWMACLGVACLLSVASSKRLRFL